MSSDEPDNGEGGSGDDPFIRALAYAPDRAPASPEPARVAHYRITRRLGRGGMGIVYRAEDEKLGRTVALKVLPAALQNDPERRSRFLREARSAAAVVHPNVATVFDVGEADGVLYIAMELLAGGTLRERLAVRALPVPQALAAARSIARGLTRAHEKGVVHRDLKPENVMFAADGEVKLVDFGLARLRTEPATRSALENQPTESPMTEEGRILGTPPYMSPEQAAGRPLDARTDVFSFGVMLYEMVTGKRPFGGPTAVETIAAILRDEPDAPSRHNPKVSVALDAVVRRCLRKDPAARFESAAHLLAALDGVAVNAQPRLRARVLKTIALAAGLIAGVSAVYGAAHRRATRSAPAIAPLRPTTILDLPSPATRVPEAAREYALGLGAFHDDNDRAAYQHFERAAQLDPSMAAAQLRLAMTGYLNSTSPETTRLPFSRAAELRASLTDRDRALLNALEPVLLRAAPDPVEAIRRIEASIERTPADVELLDWDAILRGEVPSTLPLLQQTLALDPNDAHALQFEGMALAIVGRYDEARGALERCSSLSPVTSDCLSIEAANDMIDGRCVDFERDARRLVDRAPYFGHAVLVSALAATHQPSAAVREECALTIAESREEDRALVQLALDTQLALLDGDFEAARALGAREEVAISASPTARTDYLQHYRLTMQMITAGLETGDAAGAAAIARDFAAQRGSWAHWGAINGGVDLSSFLRRTSGADFESSERPSVDASLSAGAYRGMVWPFAFAAAASTPDDARAALGALPEFSPISAHVFSNWLFLGEVGLPDAIIGHAYLLAGRSRESVPFLRRAVAACADLEAPLTHTRAALDLGAALEATGDVPPACEAFAKVLARWGNAKPRSVTADRARERYAALHCVASGHPPRLP